MIIVIWAAGIGSGMWPMANKKMPQQFIKLLKNENNEYESMFQRIYKQIIQLYSKDKIYVVINKGYEKIVRKQVGKDVKFIVEPLFQNKNLSMINAALYLKENNVNISQESLIFLSADFYANIDFYSNIKKIEKIIEKNKNPIAILGIKKEKYYKRYKYVYEKNGDIVEFINSVNIVNLREIIKRKGYINSEIIGFNLEYFIDFIKKELNISSLKKLYNSWEMITDVNIFNIYLNKLKEKIKLVKFSGEWENIGMWETIVEYMDYELFNNPKAYKIMECNTKDINGIVSIDISDNAILNMDKQCMSYISYI